MSINVGWDDDQKLVILLIYSKHWEWDEAYHASKEMNQLAQNVSHDVAIIHDLHQTMNLPPSAFMHMRTLIMNMHPRIKYNVLVGMQPMVRGLWNTFAELYLMLVRERKFLFANNVYEARGLIHQNLDLVKKG